MRENGIAKSMKIEGEGAVDNLGADSRSEILKVNSYSNDRRLDNCIYRELFDLARTIPSSKRTSTSVTMSFNAILSVQTSPHFCNPSLYTDNLSNHKLKTNTYSPTI